MLPQWVIEAKRDGRALGADAIEAFVRGYAAGEIPDYQMAALAMAVYFRSMNMDETVALTDAMLHSGDIVDTSRLNRPCIDKHSTGGVGDKISLVLAPLAACCGVAVPMMSGRALGITGGTLDKLESIPGYRVDLSVEAFLDVLEQCGCAMIGQTARLAPADRKLYALRDVTGTVPSIPLIVSSILSKKFAEGAEGLVMDVKWGAGAFMKTLPEARELARTLVDVGRIMGRPVTAVITDMNQPLGCACGNALEVAEAVAALRGEGPADVMRLTLVLAGEMLKLAGVAAGDDEARAVLQRALDSGDALQRFRRMVELQGGDPAVVDDPSRLPSAALKADIAAGDDGYLARVDAEAVGKACVALGAGRRRTDDAVDPAVGVKIHAHVGDPVRRGQPVLEIHANDKTRLATARGLLEPALEIADMPLPARPLVVETLTAGEAGRART
jgi:pyrimidine-nucleoside phosphorylase